MIHYFAYPLAALLGGLAVYFFPGLLRWWRDGQADPPLSNWMSGNPAPKHVRPAGERAAALAGMDPAAAEEAAQRFANTGELP